MTSDVVLTIIAIVVPVVEILGIITAIHAVMHARTSQGSIAWAISLVTFPWVTLPLYWIFGRSKFHGYVDLRSSKDIDVKHIIKKVLKAAENHAMISVVQTGSERAIVDLARMPFTRFNDARLLVDGETTFNCIFRGIKSARDYILVQFSQRNLY